MPTPTLKTIEKLLQDNHKEVQNRLDALEVRQTGVEEQVKLTNGRVKALETAEAVAKGIKEFQEAQSGSNPKVDWSRWFWIVVAIAAALVAIGQRIGVK